VEGAQRGLAEAVGGVTSAPGRRCNSEEQGRKVAQAEGGGRAIGVRRGRGDGRRELGAASDVNPRKGRCCDGNREEEGEGRREDGNWKGAAWGLRGSVKCLSS
jgi:hypothetical protein